MLRNCTAVTGIETVGFLFSFFFQADNKLATTEMDILLRLNHKNVVSEASISQVSLRNETCAVLRPLSFIWNNLCVAIAEQCKFPFWFSCSFVSFCFRFD